MKRTLFGIMAVFMLFAGSPGIASGGDRKGQAEELVNRAAATVGSFMQDKEFSWFQENLKKAKAVVIFPRVVKAGFFWGGSGGNGVLVARDEKTGGWSQPAFYSMGAVTYGLQIGGEESEVILLAMSRKAVDSLFVSSFKFGGDVAIAAGPHGAGVNKVWTADFISFAKAKGLYAGLNFNGSGIKVRDDLNRAYYGRDVRPVQILAEHAVGNPSSDKLHRALTKAG